MRSIEKGAIPAPRLNLTARASRWRHQRDGGIWIDHLSVQPSEVQRLAGIRHLTL
jgi:hypothetical protein